MQNNWCATPVTASFNPKGVMTHRLRTTALAFSKARERQDWTHPWFSQALTSTRKEKENKSDVFHTVPLLTMELQKSGQSHNSGQCTFTWGIRFLHMFKYFLPVANWYRAVGWKGSSLLIHTFNQIKQNITVTSSYLIMILCKSFTPMIQNLSKE